MIITIASPNELDGSKWYRMFAVKDELEAKELAGDKKGLLYKSKIITSYFLFLEA